MAGRTVSRQRSTRSSGEHISPGRAIVASSAYYRGNEAPRIYGTDKAWQRECYRFYSITGEARYAANYYAAAMSKCEMHIDEPVVAEDGRAKAWVPNYACPEADALDEMFSGRNNQGEALRSYGRHAVIGGECFVIGKYLGDAARFFDSTIGDDSMRWEVVSPLEMNVEGTNWTQTLPGTATVYKFTERDVVIRIWNPDPYQRNQADSPFKSLMPVLREIEMLSEHINSQLTSRLAGAGILWVPEGMDFPSLPLEEGEEETTSGPSKLARLIAKAGATALKDRSHAMARVPIIIQAPNELIDKARLMHFWSELDEKASEMRSGSLHRFASGMDLPNEIIEGMNSNEGTGGGRSNGVSHWGQWQIEEAAIKMHIEPAMDVFVSAITIDWIRVQVPGTTKVVAYGTGNLKLRPDRSKEAFELYDRGLLKPTALFREVGFDPSDLADDADRKAMILWKLSTGSATPDQVAAAAAAYGIELPLQSASGVRPPAQLPPAPSLEEHPTRPRDPSEQQAAALMAACHSMCLQALTRVGNRLRQKGVKANGIPIYSVHTEVIGDVDTGLLQNCFPMAREMLEDIADPADVMPHLQTYVSGVLATKGVHSKAAMTDFLNEAGVLG